MSIIFQLFRAEDLKELPTLDELQAAIGSAVRESRDPFLEAALQVSEPIKKELHQPFPPADLTPEVIETLKKRAREVFLQLTSATVPPPDSASALSGKAPSTFFEQLLSLAEFDILEQRLGAKGRTLLEWAIICELAHLRSYDALREAYDRGKAIVSGRTRIQRLKDPDSSYSPLHPSSPLYRRNPPRLRRERRQHYPSSDKPQDDNSL